MLEKDMREPVFEWLKSKGYDVVCEFRLGHYVDVIGCRFAERQGKKIPDLLYTVAVELKLSDVAGVVRQAHENRMYVHESWAAMPRERLDRMGDRTVKKFAYAGVGLLSVYNETVSVILPPKINYGLQRRLWHRLHAGPASEMICSWNRRRQQ